MPRFRQTLIFNRQSQIPVQPNRDPQPEDQHVQGYLGCQREQAQPQQGQQDGGEGENIGPHD